MEHFIIINEHTSSIRYRVYRDSYHIYIPVVGLMGCKKEDSLCIKTKKKNSFIKEEISHPCDLIARSIWWTKYEFYILITGTKKYHYYQQKLQLQLSKTKWYGLFWRLPPREHVGQEQPHSLNFLHIQNRTRQMRLKHMHNIQGSRVRALAGPYISLFPLGKTLYSNCSVVEVTLSRWFTCTNSYSFMRYAWFHIMQVLILIDLLIDLSFNC